MKALVALCIGAAAVGAVVFLATRVSSVAPATEVTPRAGAQEPRATDTTLVAPEVVLNPAVEALLPGEDKAFAGTGDATKPPAPKSAKDQERAKLEEKIERFLRDKQSARRKR